MRRLMGVSSTLLLLFAASGAQAVPLSTLVDGTSLQVGDKLFSDWKLIANVGGIDNHPNGIDLSKIDVTGDNTDPLNPGLDFTVSGGAMAVTGWDEIDLWFGFQVTVTDPQYKLKDVSLELTGWSLSIDLEDNFPGAEIWIEEYVDALDPDFLVASRGLGDVESSNLSDSAEFAPVDSIWVEKNILVYGTDVGSFASLTNFSQRFSQVQVPEPATAALLALGLVGVGFARRRRAA